MMGTFRMGHGLILGKQFKVLSQFIDENDDLNDYDDDDYYYKS